MSNIRIESLSYAYPGSTQPVLREINLNIPRGEFLLVAGPSGCGKSTLANAIAGLIPTRIPGPMRGKVYFGEKCISEMDIHETAQHIGMVFQNPDNQLIQLDVESEVAFGPENLNLPREVIQKRVKESLKYTHMESHLKNPIYALSGGQKQRIAISAALAMEPDVLVLDEPTSDLDPAGTQEVLKVLQKLNRERNMTIVLIEHKIDEVIPWVNRVLLMDSGQIVLDDSPSGVFREWSKWDDLGVSIPEMVRLSNRLPEVFSGQIALSVEEAFDAIRGTLHHRRLLDLVENGMSEIFQQTSSSSDQLLHWENVGVSFAEHQVLKDMNLTLNSGEWVALAGPNGSGKTTAASLAMGFQSPTSGQIKFMDSPVKSGKISKQAAKMGYLFQVADNMLFSSKVRDEIMFGKKHRKGNSSYLQKMTVEELASLIGLEKYLDKNPYHLSHGQRKRLAIGALLASNPQLLILDEPTTGQDEGHAKAFLEFLQMMRQQFQMPYLMITHDMRAAAHYASRLVVLNKGNIVLNGSPSQVFSRAKELSEASIIPPPIARLHGMLTDYRVDSVTLNIEAFMELVSPAEGVLV
jgi:energy-coupling factor transporter ATP-binding protein EcfA2